MWLRENYQSVNCRGRRCRHIKGFSRWTPERKVRVHNAIRRGTQCYKNKIDI